MKKLVSTVAIGILAAGVTVSNVSAAEVEVHKGDTLWEIARSQNTTVAELMDVNNLQTTIIHPNQILFIDEQYTVKQGDTLSGIAYKFGVSVEGIKEANNLASDLILTGHMLTIKGGSAAVDAPVTTATSNTTSEELTVEKQVDKEPAEPVEQEESSVEEPAEPAEQEEANVEEPAEPAEQEEANVEEPAEPAEQEESNVEEATKPDAQEEATDENVEKPAEEASSNATSEASLAEDTEQEETKSDVQQDEATNEDIKVTQNKPAEEKAEPAKEESESGDKAKVQVINATATAYTAKCEGCTGITSTGVDLNTNPNAKVIAVDPSVIPMGSKVYVEGYGNATAADTGGAIKGKKIDVHVPTQDEAQSWGTRTVKVTIVK